jgi:hypothetical protein
MKTIRIVTDSLIVVEATLAWESYHIFQQKFLRSDFEYTRLTVGVIAPEIEIMLFMKFNLI